MKEDVFNQKHESITDQQLDLMKEIDADIASAGGSILLPDDGRVGVTMFDAGSSKDNLVTVVVPKKDLAKVPSQALVRIHSAKPEDGGDGRIYQGIVVAGPFYEPDGLKADSSIIITTAAQGVTFMPKYHGRVIVEIMGEIVGESTLPPRYRPLPNSPVFPLSPEEAKSALKLEGDIIIGTAIGHQDMEVKIPSDTKAVLPRHLGIIGTTGGGKSTTVSGLIDHLQKNNIATILVDTEGEYTHINVPTEDKNMIAALERRGLQPHGVKNTKILCLVDKDSTNDKHPNQKEFSLKFDDLSPYAVMEILEFSDAQQQRYLMAYDIARTLIRRLGIYPVKGIDEHEKKVLELDELTSGYPYLTLPVIYDIVQLCARKANLKKSTSKKEEEDSTPFYLRASCFQGKADVIWATIQGYEDLQGNVASWRAIQGKLGQLLRLKIFDNNDAPSFDFTDLTTPGQVTIIDLNDTDSPDIRNLVIASLLKGLMDFQNNSYKASQENSSNQRKVMVILEEAHEFLSSQRIKQMPTLYEQVAKIARRGRKRWLGLGFVTQLPQHLPDEVLALINNYILHKISDASVISRLKRSIGSIDESMWDKISGLSSGQAIVSFSHMRRAMLTAIDPTPCKLLMIE